MGMDFSLLLPELTVIAVVAVLAGLEMTLPSFSRRFSAFLNGGGLLLAAASLLTLVGRSGTAFDGMFIADSFALFFKFLFLATAASILVMKGNDSSLTKGAEFHLILWSLLLGMFFLVSSGDFLLFFISLELLTLSLYVLTAYTRSDLLAIEAGLKYLILGSLASAFLLYGMSLIYLSTGTLSFEGIAMAAAKGEVSLTFLAGMLLILSALGFKVAAVPFQVWVPDVYQGAPTPVAAFLSVASKSAGFAALLRIFFGALGPLEGERRILFSLLASLTLLYGNLGALVQKNMKRLLGYSSIGHAGFLLIALSSAKELGGTSLLYYLIAYAFSNLTAFLVISIMEREEKSHEFESYQGLSRRSPLLAAGMFMALLSLAGVPPLAGFFAKFFILLAAARSGLFWIVFLGAMNVAISLYYYLNVVRIIYFEKGSRTASIAMNLPFLILLYGLMAGMVLVGVWQAPFFRAASLAAGNLLGYIISST